MTSKTRTMWEGLNNRIEDAINNVATLQEIKSFRRGFNVRTIDGNEKPAVYTSLGESIDKIIDSQNRQEAFAFEIYIAVDIDESTDWMGDAYELRDKLLNAIENNSSGTLDITISESIHRVGDINGRAPLISDSGKSMAMPITYNVVANYYSTGNR